MPGTSTSRTQPSASPEVGSRNLHELDVNLLGADEAWAVHMRAAPLLQLLLGLRACHGPGLGGRGLGGFSC